MDGMLFISFIFLFKEIRASVLLSKKAKKLNQWYEELEANGVFGMYLLGSSMPIAARSASSSDTCLSSGANDLEQDSVTASVKRGSLLRIRWVVEEDENRPSVLQMMATL
ncbi:hypothetical protein EsHS_00007427 [Epichloe bromicola]